MSKVGFPIRRSTDQRLFAPSRSISQRTTSFFASYRQGIHQMPLSHLIALICNAHHAQPPTQFPRQRRSVNKPRALCSAHWSSERPGPFHRHTPKRTPMQTDQKSIRPNPNLSLSATRSVRIVRGTHLRLSPSLRCQLVLRVRAFALNGTVVSSNTDTSLLRAGGRLAERESPAPKKNGGARRDRTDDLMLAKHALSQLSYGP
jgi:hypothetical protein